jgi:hypothetical protein
MQYSEPIRWAYYPNNDRPPKPLRELIGALESLQAWIEDEWWPIIHPSDKRSSTRKITKALEPILLGESDAQPQPPYGLKQGWNLETRDKYAKMPFLYGEGDEGLAGVRPDAVYCDGDRLTLVEIEGGGAFTNYRGMKDVVEAILLPSVDYLALVVPHAAHKTAPYRYYNYLVQALYGEQVVQPHFKGTLVLGF